MLCSGDLTFPPVIFHFDVDCTMHFVFQVKYSEDRGMSSDASARLILFLGINVVLGRFAGGFLCSIKRLDNLYVLQSMLLLNGVSTILLTLAQKYEALVAYSVVFGFGDGVMASVFNILILTCVDPSRAASSFGYFLLIASVTSLAGPPIAGELMLFLESFLKGMRTVEYLVLKRLYRKSKQRCILTRGHVKGSLFLYPFRDLSSEN